MRMLTAREIVSEAIQMLFYKYPLFANIAARWEILEDKTGAITQTMATNGKQLFYFPDFCQSLSLNETCWVILHECGHCFLGHHLRLKGQGTPESRNIAFDLALNSIIREDAPTDKLKTMMLFPGYGEYSELEKDQAAEFYHKKLSPPPPPPPEPQQSQQDPEDQEQEQEPDSQQGEGSPEGEQGKEEQPDKESPGSEDKQPGEGSEEQDQGSEGSKSQQEQQDSPGEAKDSPGESGEPQQGQSEAAGEPGEGDGQGEGSGEGQGEPGSAQGQQGGGAGQPVEGEQERKPYSMGEVLPSPEAAESPEAAAQAEQDWQQVVAESMALAEQCGDLPGWLRDIGRELLGESKIDWRMLLRRFLTKTTPQGVSFTRPNRRNSWRKDVILPARRSKGATDGGIIADVSGSIFKIIKQKVLPEIDKILQVLPKTSVRLLQIDAAIRDDQTFTRWDLPLQVEIGGGGGTDLDPAFNLLREDRRSLKWIVCITDMIWSYQQTPDPGIPVLWIVVGNPGFNGVPPFGEIVTVPLDKN